MIIKSEPSYTHKIWMAGNYANAENICREYCTRGMCVSIHPVNYIYTRGEESGFCVTLINYPRFPCTYSDLNRKAEELAELLREGLHQYSYTIEDPTSTRFHSIRPEDIK